MANYHYVYEVKNLLNNNIYVGVHSTSKFNDGYMGSGVIIKSAMRKHGINNFSKDILGYFDTRALALEFEKSIVDTEFVGRSDTYNLVVGGANESSYGRRDSDETRRKKSLARIGIKLSQETKGKLRSVNLGKKQTEATRSKRSETMLNRFQSGEIVKDPITDTERARLLVMAKKPKSKAGAMNIANATRKRWADPEFKSRMKIIHEEFSGEGHHSFSGYFYTPMGKYPTATTAGVANGIGRKSVKYRCGSPKFNEWYFVSLTDHSPAT